MIRTFFFAIGTLSVALLAGCQTTAPTAPTAPAASQAITTPLAELRNTRWVLRQLNGLPVATPAAGEAYLLLRNEELRAEGHGGCNRFRGTFELPAAGQLRFGALLSTRMACADAQGNSTETGFLSALTNTRTYQISGDTLRLYAEPATTPVALLHAVYLR
ncbi:META domain-containing protein [Hymenobacter sp. BT635]|uniref:META domain-containing protein n=1 Tax=Hymenobacter nitidus TaxID=2880929 RepID=A0ABS8AH04_9BACT|nr:META domain-containing protein [Hymenobacter nitidus]MCB2379131.1 META domain-containing protein [Hymenobacter nitidus]